MNRGNRFKELIGQYHQCKDSDPEQVVTIIQQLMTTAPPQLKASVKAMCFSRELSKHRKPISRGRK